MIKLSDLLKETPDVGNVLFGSDPKIAKIQGKKEEPDTSWEDKALQKVFDWVEGNSPSKVADWIKDNLQDFKSLTNKHPEILKPPVGSTCYRGTTADLNKHLKNISLKDNFTKTKIKGDIYLYSTKKILTYKPKRELQSWTLNLRTAQDFADVMNSIIFVTTVNSKDFIFNPKALNLVSNMFHDKEEDETIRITNTPTKMYCLISWDDILETNAIVTTNDFGYFHKKFPNATDDQILNNILKTIPNS